MNINFLFLSITILLMSCSIEKKKTEDIQLNMLDNISLTKDALINTRYESKPPSKYTSLNM